MAEYVEPSLTVEIRRTGESEGVRIVTGGGAVAELARFLVEHYCRMLSGGAPPAEIINPPDNDLAEGHYTVEVVRGAGWISVEERLPEPGVPVLVYLPPHEGRASRRLRAQWSDGKSLEVGEDAGWAADEWAVYDQERDTYFCPEGWFETNEYEETHWQLSDRPVTHWQPLPAPPSPAEETSGG